MPILTTNNLTVGYSKGGKCSEVLKDLNLSLNRGSMVALVGANGIGKSTLLRTIAATQQPLSGSIEINGHDIHSLRKHHLAQLLSLVYTDRTNAGGLTVRELVALGRQPHTGFLGRLSAHDREIVNSAIANAGIASKADSFVAELSDGERQKAMIAKALAQETPIIILDEPTAFLDVASRFDTMMLLHRLSRTENKAIILSSHDLSQSVLLADELWAVTSNRTLVSGTTEDIILSGTMDRMFQSTRLNFDLDAGDYRISIPTSQTVNLDCHDASLTRWLANALQRNDIGISDRAAVTITAVSAHEFHLSDPQTTVTSVSRLIQVLRNK